MVNYLFSFATPSSGSEENNYPNLLVFLSFHRNIRFVDERAHDIQRKILGSAGQSFS